MTSDAAPRNKPQDKAENLFVSLLFTVAAPTLILSKLSGEKALGPMFGLMVALAFPIGYGIYDFLKRRKTNTIAILGFVSVLASGGFGLMKLDGFWFAVKDAALPAIIGIVVLISSRTKTPFIKTLFFNPQILDVEKLEIALRDHHHSKDFERLMTHGNNLVAVAFFVSGVINFSLARYLLKSPGGTPEFNAELGKLHLWSAVALMGSAMVIMAWAFWTTLKGLSKLTGYSIEDLSAPTPKKSP